MRVEIEHRKIQSRTCRSPSKSAARRMLGIESLDSHNPPLDRNRSACPPASDPLDQGVPDSDIGAPIRPLETIVKSGRSSPIVTVIRDSRRSTNAREGSDPTGKQADSGESRGDHSSRPNRPSLRSRLGDDVRSACNRAKPADQQPTNHATRRRVMGKPTGELVTTSPSFEKRSLSGSFEVP